MTTTTTTTGPDRATTRATPSAPGGATARTAASRTCWWLVLAGASHGCTGTAWQTVERLAYAAGERDSFCNISAVLSCTSVYSHWQSSALGIPNSLIGLPVFAFLLSAAVSALTGSGLSPVYVRLALGISLFMTGFVVWYLWQTATVIGALCLFCVACLVSLTLTSSGLLRVADDRRALGTGAVGRGVRWAVDNWADLAGWVGLLALVGAVLLFGLW